MSASLDLKPTARLKEISSNIRRQQGIVAEGDAGLAPRKENRQTSLSHLPLVEADLTEGRL